MMRSLFSGVSGLKTHQTKMDVIGNNIANVNTVAFKSSSTVFQELMYQTTSKASGASTVTSRAGINAKQIGLGVATGSTSINIKAPGAAQSTGEAFDIRITGDSFFIVSDGATNYFTKAGSFYIDGAGNLAMKATGYNVMGWQVDETTGTIQQNTVTPLRVLSEKNMTSPPEATEQARIEGILDKNASNLKGDNGQIMSLEFFDRLGYAYTAKFAIKADENSITTGLYTVELTEVLDGKTGKPVPAIPLTPEPELDAAGDPKSDADGNPIYQKDKYGAIIYKPAYDPTVATTVFGTQNLQYDPDTGLFTSIGTDPDNLNSVIFDMTQLGAEFENFRPINVDFSQTKWYDNGGSSTIGASRGALDATTGTGKRLGSLIGVSVSQDGTIWGSYDNGNTTLLGQIAVANFANPSGLEKAGDNVFRSTLNSGDFDGIGEDITADGNIMSSGQLEMSNVDLSAEFTEMITTQRGFQANSRIITTSDSLLEELINLKR
ncbi:flagellar hook protein FlgE [Clostridia bacterium]|nr:flagellar hook protein FlgE [Clostridia bacterium]